MIKCSSLACQVCSSTFWAQSLAPYSFKTILIWGLLFRGLEIYYIQLQALLIPSSDSAPRNVYFSSLLPPVFGSLQLIHLRHSFPVCLFHEHKTMEDPPCFRLSRGIPFFLKLNNILLCICYMFICHCCAVSTFEVLWIMLLGTYWSNPICFHLVSFF